MNIFEALVIGQRFGLAGQPEIVFLPSIEPKSDRLLGSRIVTGCFLRTRRFKGENSNRRANQPDADHDAACPAHRTLLPPLPSRLLCGCRRMIARWQVSVSCFAPPAVRWPATGGRYCNI